MAPPLAIRRSRRVSGRGAFVECVLTVLGSFFWTVVIVARSDDPHGGGATSMDRALSRRRSPRSACGWRRSDRVGRWSSISSSGSVSSSEPTPIVTALDRAGYRLTEPRRALAALIAEQDGHFTAAEPGRRGPRRAARRRSGDGLPDPRGARPRSAPSSASTFLPVSMPTSAANPPTTTTSCARGAAGRTRSTTRACAPSSARSPGGPGTASTNTASNCSGCARPAWPRDPSDEHPGLTQH